MGNVDKRIRIHFGKEYGVQIISEPDEGTLIRMKMPLQKVPAETKGGLSV